MCTELTVAYWAMSAGIDTRASANGVVQSCCLFFFFSSRRRHTRCSRDWSSDVCSSDLRTLGTARLAQQYPEFVKSVLLAAVPEPGLWTQARILESATETSVFTHPSPRIGDPDHATQRLTHDRQRFADHRFPMTLSPLTARFFAVAADVREPREIGVKAKGGRPA